MRASAASSGRQKAARGEAEHNFLIEAKPRNIIVRLNAGGTPASPNIISCGRGGTGRRTSLRGWREQSHEGSNPSVRTSSNLFGIKNLCASSSRLPVPRRYHSVLWHPKTRRAGSWLPRYKNPGTRVPTIEQVQRGIDTVRYECRKFCTGQRASH